MQTKKEINFLNSNNKVCSVECEISDTYEKQLLGLQKYQSLDNNSGMIFTYSSPKNLSFWMGDVSFPIDIVFLNKNIISKIFHNCLPKSSDIFSCKEATSVIEVRGNYCNDYNVSEGNVIFYSDDNYNSFDAFITKLNKIKLYLMQKYHMHEWQIKLILSKKEKFSSPFKVHWTNEERKDKKASIYINSDFSILKNCLQKYPVEWFLRKALIDILVGNQ